MSKMISSPSEADFNSNLESFKNYLRLVCPPLLFNNNSVNSQLESCLNNPDYVDIIARFVANGDISMIYIENTDQEVTINAEIKANIDQRVSSSFGLIKSRDSPLDPSRPIAAQVQIVSLAADREGDREDINQAFFFNLHQLTRYFYAPVAKIARSNVLEGKKNDEDDHLAVLQKRVRELDFAVEQCVRGTAIPTIHISVPDSILLSSKQTTPNILKNYLDKYNPSQVDQLLLDLKLSKKIGDNLEELANDVNKAAKSWPGELNRQTRLVESPFSGNVEKEINFWKELDRKLTDTKEKLESAPTLLTKLVLKRTNRVSEQVVHEAEQKLDRCTTIVAASLSFLRDFPIEELINATSLKKLSKCVANCLMHFAKLKHSQYDFIRAVRLLEVLGSLVNERVVSILRQKNIMQSPIEDVRITKNHADEVFQAWKTNLTSIRVIMKDVAKRRNETFNYKVDFDQLQQRLAAIVTFREQHEKLTSILGMVLDKNDERFITELKEGFQSVLRSNVDVLDVSNSTWSSSILEYEKRLEKVEDHVTKILEKQLHDAKSAEEMFRIFSTFNPLFFRSAIRNAVNSFRTILMKNVRQDVKRLQEKFKHRYDETLERVTSDLRDIPPLSGRIIWARQIENQLSTLLKRIQDVLGVGWEESLDGKELKEVCDELRNYLDTNSIYEEWLNAQLKVESSKYNKVKDFLLLVEEDPRTNLKYLRVNFDDKLVVVFKEVKYLEWLLPTMNVAHKTIPNTILSRSTEAYNKYPVALALQSALASFTQAKRRINASNSMLLVSHMLQVREVIKEAIGGSRKNKWVKWDSKDLNEWVNVLSNKVYSLLERVDEVTEKLKTVDEVLKRLRNCKYNGEVMTELLASLQLVVDELPMKGLSNISTWVNQLDKRIEQTLKMRLKRSIKSWIAAFHDDQIQPVVSTSNSKDFIAVDTKSKINPARDTPVKAVQMQNAALMKKVVHEEDELMEDEAKQEPVTLEPYTHEIQLSNQILYLSPPIEFARTYWISDFHQHISTVCTLPRIIASRYKVFAEAESGPQNYSSILFSLDPEFLKTPYMAIENKIAGAKNYAEQWLQYQALWDASVLVVAERLGRNIQQWQQLLVEIKLARSTVDSEIEERPFGLIVINHRQVQSKINLKYDTWQKESQIRFGAILMEDIKSTQQDLVAKKTRLESISLEGPTKDVIMGVEFILKTEKSIAALNKTVSDLKASEKLLQSQRFQFPPDWNSVSIVQSTYNDMCEILDRRTAAMKTHLPSLQLKIKEEDAAVSLRTDKFLESWNTQKPTGGNLPSGDVLQTLATFSVQATKLFEDAERVRSAKESLGMEYIVDDKLSLVQSEINDLREVWLAVAPAQEKLSQLSDTLMKELVPNKMRKALEDVIIDLKELPAKVRSYAAVENITERVNKYIGLQPVLRDLCTEALKDRHWKILLQKMGILSTVTGLTVGIIWGSNAVEHKHAIAEVLSTAQGELALEQFLRDLRESWVRAELELVVRDNAKVMVGWDVLFTSLEDNLNALGSLKQSPYFKNVPEFQEDTINWEGRLTNLRGIFDLWIEVQRKWLYLRGIFKNADIKNQLPALHSKYKGVDTEYLGIMKRVSTKPLVLDLLQIDNLSRSLERQDATMSLIQKQLGDYLEKQRQIFPRFYFVNNDDLVEIIGNSNEPTKILVHLSKMFQAVSGIRMNSDGKGEGSEEKKSNEADSSTKTALYALAMCSREGEEVPLAVKVDLNVGVKDWLQSIETQMINTLAMQLDEALKVIPKGDSDQMLWIDKFPAQLIILASQIAWNQDMERALSVTGKVIDNVAEVLGVLERQLKSLSQSVLRDLDVSLRKKCEQLLTEMVHQRDVSRLLITQQVTGKSDFSWLYHLRYYWDVKQAALLKRLSIRMSNALFFYGFEYLGVSERLVQTPLTDRCYLTLTQALHFRMGGNPFGPAGTGKTESVKMLGSQLGRFTLVFNCDSSFDYAAMGRIFSGLCQVGAWGCFDEFNRLEERMLSAVSQQILTIQRGLLVGLKEIEMLGNPCKLSSDVGIFVTMNPGYAGRSNLPDNLKQLFRAVAMAAPDKKLIAQVMLFSQGIVTAEDLAGKIVLLFTLCQEQLSQQPHYDFGLRALKSVLVGAGDLKRQAILSGTEDFGAEGSKGASDMGAIEMSVLIKATCDSIVPKLVSEDIHLFTSLLQAVFPGTEVPVANETLLIEALKVVCAEDSFEFGEKWAEKVLQLKQVLDVRHGVMLVGPSGTGKTAAWRTLLKALERVDKVKGDFYVIDPKAIKISKLYGTLDPNTMEWTDGVFTKILRKVSDTTAVRGVRRSWIVFDGDVDPEWAENLNSVLDDNKVLTLPSGDRLKIPNNVRIMMEVDTLKHATLATVSRCGMVWFARGTVSLDMILRRQLRELRNDKPQVIDPNNFGNGGQDLQKMTQNKFVDAISPLYIGNGDGESSLVMLAMQKSQSMAHVMDPDTGRLLETLYCLMLRGVSLAVDYNDANFEFPMADSHIQKFATKWLLFAILWSFGGSMTNDKRLILCEVLSSHSNVESIAGKAIIDLQASVSDGSWVEWSSMVPRREIEPDKVSSTDVVVTTTDTVRHVEVLKAWLAAHKPLILCGPPGSGKTMTLTSVLDSMPQFVLAALNFSSGTTPELITKTFAQYCEVVDSPDGLVLQPNRQTYSESQWLVVFCDECNLPEQDMYGTQAVIMFIRQLTEQGGYWSNDCKWVTLRRIQFVGACNPPTDAGRVVMSERFLRHAPLLLVDYPAEESLKQIYGTFVHGLLKLHTNLLSYSTSLTDAMVAFYLANQRHFNADMAPQYIYSPRELSRWVRALYEGMKPLDAMTADELVRLWGHEALRLFSDRLIQPSERAWCDALVDEVAASCFSGIDCQKALQRPMLYSSWISKCYQSIDRETLREFLAARLKVFYEEELDVPLVIFDEVLDHVLRIDNVLSHPMGHLLLVGESGAGKTVLTKFVAWINHLTIFQIKANNRYTIDQFFEDLRGLFRRVGVDGEKICFIFDESNALSSAFLESMNALLASGEVPGLFEGDERTQLMAACRESFAKQGLVLDSEDELTRRFTKTIQRNLHVAFTMNPAGSDFENRSQTSPALFNRCVVDWFGTWSLSALAQVASEFTRVIDTGYTEFDPSKARSEILAMVMEAVKSESVTLSEAIVAALVSMHESVKKVTVKIGKATGRMHYLSPRDYLDLIKKFVSTEKEKRDLLEEQQMQIRKGIDKLLETEEQVNSLSGDMVAKGEVLRVKDAEANMKLTQMVDKQNEAERSKAIAEKLTVELVKQNEQIRVRKDAAERELADAEPALLSAKNSVSGIKKAQLDEVRALGKPPNNVRLTMEMVAIMIGEKDKEWENIRKIIRKDDFIPSVVNFDPMSLNPRQVKTVQEEYLARSDFDYASVDRASKACGPLYKWAESQIKYATILKNIKPLRDEMAALQQQSNELSGQHQATVQQVSELENAIKTYKMEYAQAIRDTETIRTEMEVVSKKVVRAQALLGSLGQEKVRWQATSASFDKQMSTLIGDNLLAAAFLTYGGIFDHKVRNSLQMEWSETLENLGIPFRQEMEMVSHLSSPSAQVQWRDWGLPIDELAIQNAILLERYNRYPLIVDPSGQASAFILKKYASQKIVQTSFLDPSFYKTLASALRFGTPLLVQDVESIDPMLNPVLNKELQKTGGRTLIRLGSEDIDFSPKFLIVLVTRNPMARFAPDLCSRVTMINFTVTPASLESQVLSAILKSERPDIDRRRTEVLRLQGEQSAKLRDLQEALLSKISAVQGAILDDDSVINTLEKIKADAAQLNEEVDKTKEIMEEVKGVSNTYIPLASAMSSVYFSLEGLAEINFLYQFSLQFFFDILNKVLGSQTNSSSTTSSNDGLKRLKHLKENFFLEVTRRALRGLRFEDKLMFVVRLAQIATQGQFNLELSDGENDLLLRGAAPLLDSAASLIHKFKESIPNRISDLTARQLVSLSLLPAFADLLNSLSSTDTAKWIECMDGAEPELHVPLQFIKPLPHSSKTLSEERASLLRILIIRALRPDRTLYAMEMYVKAVFGESYDWRDFSKIDLKDIVVNDSTAKSPMMLCSEAGQDASSKVDSLSRSLDKQLLQVSMGSAEGYTDADKSISQAAKTGAWVLLRNVHLCSEWLGMLEKKLHGMACNENFRLFLTCEIHPKLPSALLRVSEVLVYEASTGIKANIQRFYNSIPTSRIDKAPVERVRLYGLLAWLNAVIQERLRYVPLGWTKRHEFSEADTACSLDVIDQWVDEVSGQRAHIDPNDLPWQALQVLLSQSLYGGRVDDPFDQAALDSFIGSIFTAKNYNSDASLAMDHDGRPLVSLPDSLSRQALEAWIKALPDSNSPAWIGLPVTAESQLKAIIAQRTMANLTLLQGSVDTGSASSGSARSQLDNMQDLASKWTAALPSLKLLPVVNMEKTSDAKSLPLDRCLAREVIKGRRVISIVMTDLDTLSQFCRGEIKQTNAIRDLMSKFSKGLVPSRWKAEYAVASDMTVTDWVSDLTARSKSLDRYVPVLSKQKNTCVYWIGGMFDPNAFITATRQQTAQVNKWSLEDLELFLLIGDDRYNTAQDSIVEGLIVEGAKFTNGSLLLADELRSRLPTSKLQWRLKGTNETSADITTGEFLSFPLYLNEGRKPLVSQVLIEVPRSIPKHVWSQRGVAIILQSFSI